MVGPDQLAQNSSLSTQEDWNLVFKITACFGKVVLSFLDWEEKRFKAYVFQEGHPGICKMKSLACNFV